MKYQITVVVMCIITALILGFGQSEAVKVTVSDVSGDPGQTGVVVGISIDDATGILSGKLTFSFDPTVLTYKKNEVGPVISGLSPTPNSNNVSTGRFTVSFTAIHPIGSADGSKTTSGEIIKITFDIKSTVTNGTTSPLTLQAAFLDKNGSDITLTTKNGTLTIKGAEPSPVANFTSSTTSGIAPLTVTFTDQSSNNPTSWLWDFGDGGTSSEKSPTHTYQSAGTYTVKLTATNTGGSNTKTTTIKVDPPPSTSPQADFSVPITSGTVPLTVQFADKSTNNPTSWLWEFGDGGTSSEKSPTHTYQSAGTYTVKLTVTNDGGSSSKTLTITGGQTKRREFTSATGNPVYIISMNGNTPNTVDNEDFQAFAQVFNKRKGETDFNIQADLNDDGKINFTDFIIFLSSFGKTAAGKPAAKPVVNPSGANEKAQFLLYPNRGWAQVDDVMHVEVTLANVVALTGYGFTMAYDPNTFAFLGAAPADGDLLKSTGGETPLFFFQESQAGQLHVGNAIVNGSAVRGSGAIAQLTFQVLKEPKDNTRFDMLEGVVFDPALRTNRAVVANVWDIRHDPAEFVLHQNHPNPFNPETQISYQIREQGEVQLVIYNALGQQVNTLVQQSQEAGVYRVMWNGKDDLGRSVSSGVYFYQLTSNGLVETRRMLLLK